MLALRQESDAVRVITERLKVKEMGPADHIRTKHEAKAFVQSGDLTAAEALLKNAHARRELNQSQSITAKMTTAARRADGAVIGQGKRFSFPARARGLACLRRGQSQGCFNLLGHA